MNNDVVGSTGEVKKLLINQANIDLTEEEIKEAQKKMESLKILPWEEEENRALLERGLRLYQETVGEIRQKIQACITAFEAAMASQNVERIKSVASEIRQFFDSLEDEEIW